MCMHRRLAAESSCSTKSTQHVGYNGLVVRHVPYREELPKLRQMACLRMRDPTPIGRGKLVAIQFVLTKRTDSLKHDACYRARAFKAPPQQRGAERRSVGRFADENLLGRSQRRKAARKGLVAGKAAIDDDTLRAAERIETTACAKCGAEHRKSLAFGGGLR